MKTQFETLFAHLSNPQVPQQQPAAEIRSLDLSEVAFIGGGEVVITGI